MEVKYAIKEIEKKNILEYLQKNNFNKETILDPMMKGWKTDKYDFKGILKEGTLLLRLRFGQPNGIDTWRIPNNEYLKSILDNIYYDKALTEWVKVI